ncbi:MAG: phosphoribosylformylglycinamidine cyclo-ligase [Propionibacteriaceae bacterium]|jgi:phosphoribosylformylglycinamidine cyclo-ligase|nr:phosphoribosylformylglycinamidine cyclo-ligase [Propionibacteriaceae bacterium]
MTDRSAYARAGVDIQAGEEAVELMKAHVARTHRPEVMGGLGGFAGFFDAAAFKNYRHPVLATSTDGVGTKVAIAQAMGVYDTIGFDLVGMLVDDLVVAGAEPLFVTDYIACGRVEPQRVADIVAGIAAACAQAGAALLGGETAEHPGLLGPDDFDVAGATTGVVEADEILGADRVQAGDKVICLASSGLHSNGYSLVRRVLLEQAGLDLTAEMPEFGHSLGEELLTPTRVYAKNCLAVARAGLVHAMSHITGGGLANNLGRVMPTTLMAVIDRSTWTPGPIFDLVQRLGAISQPDIEETLNMGVGMVLLCPDSLADQAIHVLRDRGETAWVAGVVQARSEGDAAVVLHGRHR